MTAIRYTPSMRVLPLLLVATLLSSCSRAPSVEVVGSFFPAWLLCFMVAVVLTAFVRLLLLRFKMNLPFPILVYPSLAAVFTFALWLIFFY